MEPSFSTTDVPSASGNNKIKILVTGLILIIGLTAVASGWYYYFRPKAAAPKQTKVLTKPKIIKQKSPVEKITEGHGSLFYIDLEYNPKNGAVLPKSVGLTDGETPALSSRPPPNLDQKFAYKIDLISEDGALLQSGWNSVYKEIVEDARGFYQLKVFVSYKPKTTLIISSVDNQIIYSTVIK